MRLTALSILSTVCILHTVPGTSAQFDPFQNGPYKTMHKYTNILLKSSASL